MPTSKSIPKINFSPSMLLFCISYSSISWSDFELIDDRRRNYLAVLQKRSSLLIRWNDGTFSSERKLLAEDAWDCDDQGGEEEDSHDNEGKDPLECNDLGEELANADRGGQDAQCEAHGVVLVCDEEEQSIYQNTPNRNIGQNAGWQSIGINCDGSIPVQSNKCPCQWSRNNWDMDESRVRVVAEVERGEVEEVDGQDDLSPDVVAADEQHDERELEEVVDDEVASNTSCCVDIVGVRGEKVPDVSDLQEEEEDPVDRGDDCILGEWSGICSVYSPDGVTPLLNIIVWNVEGVVYAGDHKNQP